MRGHDRSDPGQQPPDPARDYSRFPPARVRTGARRWRVHQRRFQPWFYSSGAGGRFNLDDPFGTLYVASHPDVALRESAGTDMVGTTIIDADWADRRAVSHMPMEARTLANLRSSRAPSFGIIPGEVTGPFMAYRLTRAWAATFHGCGFGGVRYTSRFAPPGAMYCEAVFGQAGPVDGQVCSTTTVRELVATMPDYRLVEIPSSRDIMIVDTD